MVGCMMESSIGISGAAHLLPLLDYADLDGAILLKHDPATGVQVDCGQIKVTESPGTGADLTVRQDSPTHTQCNGTRTRAHTRKDR